MAEIQSGADNNADAHLRALFSDGFAAVPDNGFSDRLLAAIKRRERIRTLVIAAAAGLGGVLALAPIAGSIGGLGQDLLAVLSISEWTATWFRHHPGLVSACLATLLMPFAVRLLES